MTFDEYHEILYANRPEMAPPDWNGGAGQTEQEQSGGLHIGVYGKNGETRDATEDESNKLISYLNDTANSFNERFAQIQDYISNGAFTPDESSKYSSMLTDIEKEIEDSRSTVYDLGWRGVEDVYSEWSGIAGEIRSKLDEKKPNEETDILGAYNKPYSYNEYVKSLDAAYEEAKAEKKSISSKINNYSPQSSIDEYSGWATDDLTALNMSGISNNYGKVTAAEREAKDALKYARDIQASAQAIKEAEKEAALEARYKGMTYDDVQREIQAGSSDSEWLTAHQYDQMFFPDAQRREELISEKQSQLDEIVSQLNTAKTELAIQSAREEEGIGYNAETTARAKQTVSELTAQKDEIESAINTLRNNKYFSEQEEKYSSYADKISRQPIDLDKLKEIILEVERDENGGDFLENATSDEKSILQYIYNNDGRKAAQEYYDYVSYAVNQRATEKYVQRMAERAEKNPVLWNAASVPMNLGAGGGYIDALRQNAANRFTGEYKPIDYYTPAFRNSRGVSTIRGVTAQNIVDKTGLIELDEEEHPVLAPLLNGKSLGDAYQLGMSTLDSAATAALSVFGIGAVGSAFLGGAAATDGILQALERGATDSQALAMGTYNGVFEALGEYASIGKLIKEPTKVLASLLTQAGVEASEEVFTTIANTIADAATMRDKSEYKQAVNQYMSDGMSREEAEKRAFVDTCVGIIWDGIGGAVMGGVSGAGHAGLYYGANAVKGNLSYKGNAQELLSKAKGTAQDSEAYRLAGEYQGRRMTNKMAAQLYEAINTADVQSLKAAVSEQLGQMNVTENEDSIAEAVAKSALGQELTEEQKRVVENDENAKELLRELNDGLYSLDRAKNAKDVNWIYNAKTQGAQTGAQQIKTFQDFVKQAAEQEKKGTVSNVPSDTFNIAKVQGTDVRIIGISQDGQIKGVLPDGENVDVSSENLSAGQRQYFDLLRAEYGKDAGAMFKILGNGSGNLNKAYYGARTLMAVARNSNKASFDENIRKNLQSTLSALSDKQAEAIWSLAKSGQRMSAERLRRQYKDRVTNEDVTIDGEVFRGIDFSEDLSDDVSFAISLADTLAGAAKGRLTVNLYHGGEDSKVFGRYENGRIDVNIDRVDKSGKSMVMYTLSHELTHYIKEASGAKYRTFAEVLTDHIMDEEGKTLERLIQEKKARDQGISNEEAMDEIVADGCERMLENTEIFNKLAQKDKSLAGQVADYIKKMLKRLYEGITGKHYEAKVAQKYIAELQELWDNALEDALTGEESDTETGEQTDPSKKVVAYSKDTNDNSTIKKQIQNNLSSLNKMEPASIINIAQLPNGSKNIRDWAVNLLKSTGYKVNRQGYGDILFTPKHISEGIKYLQEDAEVAAFSALPKVLKRGIIIESHKKHKGNLRDSVTIAAPIVINGVRGNMAVAITVTTKNHYHVHRILMPDGSKFTFDLKEEKTVPTMYSADKSGEETKETVFIETITSKGEKSKRKSVADSENPLTDSDGKQLSDSMGEDVFEQIQAKRMEINELRTKQKSLEASDEYDALIDEIFKQNASPEVLAKYTAWDERTGFSAITESIKSLEQEVRDMMSNYEAARADRLAKEEADAIEKSGLSEADYFRKKAVKEFGYTPYFYDAGYIIPNGKMLNFSGEKGKHFGSRGEDHRAIGRIYALTQGTAALVRFVNDGNIRIIAESPGLDIAAAVEPSKEQYATIRRFITDSLDEGYFSVDFSDANGRVVGTLQYENRINSTRIINDIKHYYSTGEIREQSSTDKFRFSRADVDERDFAQRLAESEKARKKLERGMVQAQKTIDMLRKETKASKVKTANPQDVRKFARDILKSYPYTSVKAADIYDRVQQIADGFMRESDTGELYQIALDVATEIIDNSYVRLSLDGDILGLNEGYTFADEIRGYLKNQKTVYIDRDDAQDAAAQLGFESYRALRSEMRKYGLTLSTTSSNISSSVDSMYSELNSMYPGIFPAETNVAAELENIRRAASEDEFNPYYDRKRSELAHLDIDFVAALANDILEGAVGEEVRQYYSAVDKAVAREKARQNKAAKIVEKKNMTIDELRQKRKNDLAALRKADKEKLDALRAEKNKRIQQIKAEGTAQRIELVRWYKERRQKAELRDKIFKLKTKADQMTIRSTKTSHVPPSLMRPVSEMCSILTSAASRNVDSRQTRLDKRLVDAGIDTSAYEEKSERLKITQAKLNELQKAYERISSDETYDYVYDEAINKMLNELSTMLAGTHLYAGDFSVEDLSRVYEIMSAVMYSVENANKATALETDENLKEFVSRFSNDIDNASAMSGLMSKLESTMLWQLRPDTFFNYICGYAKNNAGQDVQQMFVQGTERKLTVQREFYKMFRSITETNNADWKRKYRQMTNNPMRELVEWGLKDENGNSVATSRGMMLQAYMLLNQEDSFKSLRIGGFRLANMKEYYHGNISEAYGIGSVLSENLVRQYGDVASEIRALRESMNDENADTVEAQIEEMLEVANDILLQAETNLYGLIDQIEKQLTDFDRAVLDAAREWYDYSGKKLDEINLEMYGIKKPRPKNYTPIHRDTTSVMSVDIRSMQDTVNLENLGSTKQRVRSTAPILLTDIFYELDSNQKKMSNFFGFVKVQNDFNKIYKMKAKRGGQSIEGKIARKFGSGTKSFTVTGTQYVENYIRSVAGGAGETSVLGGLFGNAAQATLSLNPRVAVSQLASIPTAAAVVGWDNVLKGFYRGMKTSFSKSGKEQLAETSVWFWQRYRGTGGITEVADMKANRGNVISRTWNQIASTKVGGALLNWCQDMDVLATASMYAMAEEKAKKLGIDITSYAGKKRVNEIYTEIIRKTQPNYTATERSDMLRDHRDSLKVLTMYKTQSNQNLNILIEASGEFNRAKRDFKRGAATEMDVREARIKLANASTAVVLGGTVAFAGLRFLANLVLGTLSNYRDDDEELTKESIIKGLAKDIGSSLSGMFALSGNLYDAFYSAFGGERYYGLSDTALSNIGSVLSNTVTLINKAMDENRNIELKDIDKEISSLCNIIGIPYGNSKKIIDGVKMWYNDIRNGTFGQFEGNVERTDSQNINRFLHAYVDGDTEKMDSVYTEMLGDGDWRRKKELEGKFKSKAFKMFIEERTIDADSVKQLLMDYSGLADYQAEALVNEWQGIIDYGFDSSEASDAYVNGEMSAEEYSIYLSTVKGYDADKISSEIKNLDCKRDTGMYYNELHDAYMYDAISAGEAKKLINKYSNEDTDADQVIARWDFEKQTGYTWSNVHRAFKANKVSEAELKNYYQRVYGDSEEEAAIYVEIAKWKRDVPGAENFTKEQYNNYIQGQTYLEAANVSKSMFAKVAYAYHNDPKLKSDKDENGKAITNSKLKKVMAYIDSLNISADQKMALALSFYKSKSNVNKYKLW